MAPISRFSSEWFVKKEKAFLTGFQRTCLSLGRVMGFGFFLAIFAKTGSWQITLAWMASGKIIVLLLTIVFVWSKINNNLEDIFRDLATKKQEFCWPALVGKRQLSVDAW